MDANNCLPLRLGTCEMCSSLAAKYTCPGCEINTCSVNCVKEHKTTYDCDGKRNKTAYKPLAKLSDTDFQSGNLNYNY